MKECVFYNNSIALRAGVPAIFRSRDLSEIEERNEEQAQYKGYLQAMLDKRLNSLVVLGTVGNGKTLIACAMLNDYLNYNPDRGLYMTQDNILDSVNSAMSSGSSEQRVVEFLSNKPVLIIDEIKPVNWTEKNKNIIQKILVSRHANGLRTVLIGNLSADQFKTMFDEHVRSRLREGKTIVMLADDMREKSII